MVVEVRGTSAPLAERVFTPLPMHSFGKPELGPGRCYTYQQALSLIEADGSGHWPGVDDFPPEALSPTMRANPSRCFSLPEGMPCFLNDAGEPCSPLFPPAPPPAPGMPSVCGGCAFVDVTEVSRQQGERVIQPLRPYSFDRPELGPDRCYTYVEALRLIRANDWHWPGVPDYTLGMVSAPVKRNPHQCFQ